MIRNFSILSRRYLHFSQPLCWNVPQRPELDLSYLLHSENTEEIKANIARRKGVGDIQLVSALKTQLDRTDQKEPLYDELLEKFHTECLRIPNMTHPKVIHYGEESKVVKKIGEKKFLDRPLDFQEIAKRLNIARTEHLGNVTGTKSYFLHGELAELENALVRYTVDALKKNKFEIITVPDIIHRDIIEACGLNTRGERTQVFTLDENKHESNLCLAGTSEMSMAGYFMNTVIPIQELPKCLATVSRCFRAETSKLAEEKGIFRVHEFTKVEMFVLCKPDGSDAMLESIREFEEEHFASLGLHLQTVDMASPELGAPAYRKYDIEAWMPGRNMYGEISSCSNCTDYQTRRLNTKYKNDRNQEMYLHSLNGTACAVPRMLIALVETYQNPNGTIGIPNVLQQYIGEKILFGKQKTVPELKLIKSKK